MTATRAPRPPTKNEVRIQSLERQIEYLRADLAAEREHSRRLAEQLQEMFNGPADARLAEAILSACNEVDPAFPLRGGPLVTFDRLRTHPKLQASSKPAFDRAVIRLAESSGAVCLHSHDHAGRLTPVERDVLVMDGRGGFYIGLSTK